MIEEALDSPLLNRSDILGAKDILLNITSGTDEITMDEMTEITNYVIQEVGDSAAVIWGVGTDERLGDAISVTIIATGFPMDDKYVFPDVVVDATKERGGQKVETKKQKEEINKNIRNYVDTLLQKSEVALRPDLSEEEIEKLMTIPAYRRRDLKIDRT